MLYNLGRRIDLFLVLKIKNFLNKLLINLVGACVRLHTNRSQSVVWKMPHAKVFKIKSVLGFLKMGKKNFYFFPILIFSPFQIY